MKKFFLLIALTVFGMIGLKAQNASFGVTAGYTNLSVKATHGGSSVSKSKSGFYLGALADVDISEQFHVQPEALYAHVGDGDFIYVPVLVKYYISNSGFQIMAGPQATFALDAEDPAKTFGLDITAGLGFDITEHVFVDARYSFGITNRLKNAPDGVKLHINTFNIGIGYKF